MAASAALDERKRLVLELAQISDAEARRSFLRANRCLHHPAAVELLYEEVVRLARADLRQADRLTQAASWIAEKLGDDFCRAQSLRATGHVSLIRGRYAAAVRSYRAALALFRRLGRVTEVGRTLYGGSLQALIYLGQYEEAMSWALEARDIFRRHGDRLRLARLDTNMGNILYRQDRFEEALEYYRRALAQFRRQSRPEDVAITLRNIAVCHISLGDFSTALKTYEQARIHCERNGMPLMVAEADYNIAYLFYQRGEYARAVDLYHSTRKHCERLGDPYHKALCDLDESEMYLELNLDEEGAQLAGLAAALFKKLGMRYEEAKGLTFLAIAASHQGKAKRALDLFVRGRRLFARERNRFWVAMIDLYQAIVLYRNGSYDEARGLCESALAFFSGSSLHSKAALCELLRARLHLQAGENTEAEVACLSALKRLDEAEAPVVCCQAHLLLGQVRELRQDFDSAFRAYKRAHALLEDLRSHLKGEELKIAFLKDKLAVYESLVWMCLERKRGRRKTKSAFTYIEQAKSRSLADSIACRTLDLPEDTLSSDALPNRVRRQRTLLNWYYRQIDLSETGSDQPPGRITTLHRLARTCEEQLVKSLAELRHSDRQFAVLQNAHAVELEAIRSVIPEDHILLEYYEARGTFYASLLGRNTLAIIPVADVTRVRGLLRLLQFQISKQRLQRDQASRYDGTSRAATETHLRELYNELIGPVRRRLRADHLVVVPHGILHYLPFHALHDGTGFLIDEFSVSYAPSASVYYLCCSDPKVSENKSLVLGIPDSLTPHILDEATGVAAALPNPRLFIGQDATGKCLREHGPGSRFVHIAAHGLFRHDNPMFSSMRLGDSHLSLLDLYSLNLSSELVTLSGCSTGLNAVVAGDELLGLVRGLLSAGTRGVLVSLWDVDDRSTAHFMKSFYRHFMASEDKPLAMQTAMREMRRLYPHPYYWAPFVLIGRED